MKKTKIIATVGPATDSIKSLEELYNSGTNIIRLNFSHGNHEYFSKLIKNIRLLNKSGKTDLSIMLDNKGPEIRTKKTDKVISLVEGEKLLFTSLKREKNIKLDGKKIIVCNYEHIISDLKVGNIIDIDTGLLKVKVIEKNKNYLLCKSLNKHDIASLRHVNLPGVKVKLPGLNKQDKKDILFGIKNKVDFISLSFVRNKKNILELKKILKENNATDIKIISKIENKEGIDNIDEIIKESDGVMIARGDLGAEVDFETIPVLQKMIGDKAKFAGKFFIVTTQMLESMMNNKVPTRAEVTDIFTACMQKADCTMLSGETVAGKYPIETVLQMTKIIKYSESQLQYKHSYFGMDSGKDNDKKAIVKNTIYTAESLGAKAIIIFTGSGYLARTMSAFKPRLPVFAFTFDDNVVKKLNILFGVSPFVIKKKTYDGNMSQALKILKEKKLIKSGDKIVNLCNIKQEGKIVTSIQIRII